MHLKRRPIQKPLLESPRRQGRRHQRPPPRQWPVLPAAPPDTPEGEMSARVCCHDKSPWVELQPWGPSYFTPNWLAGVLDKSTYPMKCTGICEGRKTFTTKPKAEIDVSTEFKVTKKDPAYVCPNAAKHNHKCVYALCARCLDMKVICDSNESECSEWWSIAMPPCRT